jgi:hypothetical protein
MTRRYQDVCQAVVQWESRTRSHEKVESPRDADMAAGGQTISRRAIPRCTISATCGGIDAAVAMAYDLFMDDERIGIPKGIFPGRTFRSLPAPPAGGHAWSMARAAGLAPLGCNRPLVHVTNRDTGL